MKQVEPRLPNRVKHIQGLYTRKNSDLFIDDLTSDELRTIADHREWCENKDDYRKDAMLKQMSWNIIAREKGF